jgi:hypothetical protein
MNIDLHVCDICRVYIGPLIEGEGQVVAMYDQSRFLKLLICSNGKTTVMQ